MCLKGNVAILRFEIRPILSLEVVMSHVSEGKAEHTTIEVDMFWRDQYTIFKFLSCLLSQQLQNIQNTDKSLKHTLNFVITKKSLTQ